MTSFSDGEHPRDPRGKFTAHAGAEQEGTLEGSSGTGPEAPEGLVPDARFDIPGGHVQREMCGDGSSEWPEWQLNHGYYGMVKKDGKARWCVERTDGFDGMSGRGNGLGGHSAADAGSAQYAEVLREIDRHCSAVSHIVAHHAGSTGNGIRLRIEKTEAGELAVYSYDSFKPLGTVHADGTYTVAVQQVPKKIEPFTGLDYY